MTNKDVKVFFFNRKLTRWELQRIERCSSRDGNSGDHADRLSSDDST